MAGRNYKYFKYSIALLLFLLPFFWYSGTNLLLGEDDIGLLYSDPIQSIRTIEGISTWWSSGNIATYNPLVIRQIPFALFLACIKFLTLDSINLQQFSFGLILSLSFIFIVKLLEFFTKKKSVAFLIAALFYSLSPAFFVREYFYLMPSTFNIALYPIVAFFFLKGYETHKNRYYLIGSIFTFIFAESFFNPPYGVAFFSFFFLFLAIYNKLRRGIFFHLLREIIKYSLFIMLINIFLLLQLVHSFSLGSSTLTEMRKDRGVITTEQSVALRKELQQPKALDFLLNIFPFSLMIQSGARMFPIYIQYLNQIKFLGIIIPIVISIAIITSRKNNKYKKLILFFSAMSVITFSCVTITVFPFGENIFEFLTRKIPGFCMWRHPSSKFSATFLFYYLITFGLSLFFLYKIIRKKYIKVFVSSVLLIVLFILCKPFLFGDFVNKAYPPFSFTREMNFDDPDFVNATIYLKNINDDGNIFWLPMGYGYAMFIPADGDGAYRGPTPLKYFTSKTTIGNISNLVYVRNPEIKKLARNFYFGGEGSEDEDLLKLARILNFKYIMVYTDIAKLRKHAEIIPSLTYDRKDYYKGLVLDVPLYKNNTYEIYKIKNYNDISKFTATRKDSDLLFRKVSDYYYQIAIKTDGPDRIIFNEPFSTGWELFKIPEEKFNCENPKNLSLNNKNILECNHTNKNILSLQNSFYLFKNKMNFVHSSENNFNNSWKIDTNGKFEYFDLFFSGQKYVDIGLFISGIILLGYLGYLGYDWRRRRKA